MLKSKFVLPLFAIAMVSVTSLRAQECCTTPCDAMLSDSCCSEVSCCEPLWTVTADALFLHRSDPDENLLGFNLNDPTQRFDASNLDFGTESGFDLSLTRRLQNGTSLELRYFGVDDWSSSFTGQTTNGDLLRFNAAIPIDVTAGDSLTANYQSKLHNAEFNLSHACYCNVDFLIGFRYLELDERGSVNLVGAAVPFGYQVSARNRLYGAQLGARAWLVRNDHLSIESTMKAGVFGNHSGQNSSATTGAGSLPATGHDDQAAFVGEIGVKGAARISDHLSLRGGYRMLWIDSVATAVEQLGATDFFAGTGLDNSGDVFYHGAFAGLEMAY